MYYTDSIIKILTEYLEDATTLDISKDKLLNKQLKTAVTILDGFVGRQVGNNLPVKVWREYVLKKYGDLCVVCQSDVVILHHVFSVDIFPELFTDKDNGIPLCHSCHLFLHSALNKAGVVTRLDFEQVFSGHNMTISEGYTVEELSVLSGYSIKTIYNLTAYKVLHPPYRGADPSKYRSKGLYTKDTLLRLKRFSYLKDSGMKKEAILATMRQELEATHVHNS